MMNATRTLGLLCIALAAGGAALSAPPRALAQAETSVTPAPAEACVTPAPAEASVAPAPAKATVTPAPAKASVTPAPAKARVAPAPAEASVTPAPAKKPELPLDVEALKTRLRETKAIGFFTKLELQNQMNDLLQQFRERYENGQSKSVAALRQPFDMLVLKVLALVQDGDPPLARTILQSREALWKILADPEKFKSVS